MDFAKLASLSIGLAGFLGGLWIVLQIVKSVRRNGNGKAAEKAGERSTEEWLGRMRQLHEEANKKLLTDVASLMDKRNDKIREIVRDELGRGVHE